MTMKPEDLDELRSVLEDARDGPQEGWSHTTGQSPMKMQLEKTVELLKEARGQMVKEYQEKLKLLEQLQRHKVTSDPRYRVKKHGHNR